jgi:hypothetical protein
MKFSNLGDVNTICVKLVKLITLKPGTVAERSKGCTLFARSERGLVGSKPTQGMNVLYVYAFNLCLCFPVFR